MMRRGARNRLLTATLSGLLLAVPAWQPAAAESVCKGLEKPACGKSSACRWVEGYKRKDGKTVDGYCRANGSQKTSADPTTKGKSGH
jgi:hypothetical protein